jgi:hypothetical protein
MGQGCHRDTGGLVPWVRIDENALDHPKLSRLSDGAFRLWVRGLAHCQKYLTDGALGADDVRGFRGNSRARVRELVTARLWDQHENDYHVHDYLKWNDGRDVVIHKREQARDRLTKYRQLKRVATGGERTVSPSLHSTNKIKSTDAARRPVEISDGTFALYTKIAAEARDLSIRQDDDESISNIAENFKTLCAARKLSYDSELAARAIAAVMASVARRSA